MKQETQQSLAANLQYCSDYLYVTERARLLQKDAKSLQTNILEMLKYMLL